MGANLAKTELNNAINQSLEILNTSTQECKTTIANITRLNFTGCDVVEISDVILNQTGRFDIECATRQSSTSGTESKIKTEFTQAANAINQALNLNPGSNEAIAITNLTQNLSNKIANTYNQECLSSTVNEFNLGVVDCDQASFQRININQASEGVINCTQESDAVSSLRSQIENKIDQTATAEIQSILGPFALIAILVIIVIIIFTSQSANIVFYLIILGVIVAIGYFALAFFQGWWPFNTTSTNSNEDNPNDTQDN